MELVKKNVGKPSALFAEPIYVKSDIVAVVGRDKMQAVRFEMMQSQRRWIAIKRL